MRHIIILSLIILVFGSCQEVVNIDLNSTGPKLVVEGEITNRPGPYKIMLSRTTNFFDNNTVSPETGAQVIISDDAGAVDTLKESTSGVYKTNIITGKIGRTYNLSIVAQGQKYVASANMMDTVTMDSLNYILSGNKNQTYRITAVYQDPPTTGNNYGFRTYRNSLLLNDIVNNRVASDKLTNGLLFRSTFRNDAIVLNDAIRVELLSMNLTAYNYYNTLKQVLRTGSPFSVPPANPVTNLSNGALGFFGVYSITNRSVVIQ